MLRQHQASLDDKKKFTALVKDLFPAQAKNVNLLLMAYNMGIAQDIRKVSYINNTFAFRYVKQLMDDFGMSRVNADWIVSVWCDCYGYKVLGKVCDISVQSRERDLPFKENRLFRANPMVTFLSIRKAGMAMDLRSQGFEERRIRPLFFKTDLVISLLLRLHPEVLRVRK